MMKKIIKTLLLCSLSLVMITGCESMGQVTVDNEKVNKILNMSQEEAEEKIANYTEKAKSELKEQIKKELAKQDGSAEPGILSGVEDIALMTGIPMLRSTRRTTGRSRTHIGSPMPWIWLLSARL